MLLGKIGEKPHHDQTGDQDKHEERTDLHQNQNRRTLSGTETGEEGENHDTDDIVDQRRTQQRGAGSAFQFSHFVQGLHGDAHRCGGKHGANEGGLQQIVNGKLLFKEEEIDGAAEDHGNQHAHHSDGTGLQTRVLHLLQIRVDACKEHNENNADLSGLDEKIRAFQHAESAGAENDACQQSAHYLGHMDFLRDQTQQFGGQENGRENQKIGIIHVNPSFQTVWGRTPENIMIIRFPHQDSRE